MQLRHGLVYDLFWLFLSDITWWMVHSEMWYGAWFPFYQQMQSSIRLCSSFNTVHPLTQMRSSVRSLLIFTSSWYGLMCDTFGRPHYQFWAASLSPSPSELSLINGGKFLWHSRYSIIFHLQIPNGVYTILTLSV